MGYARLRSTPNRMPKKTCVLSSTFTKETAPFEKPKKKKSLPAIKSTSLKAIMNTTLFLMVCIL